MKFFRISNIGLKNLSSSDNFIIILILLATFLLIIPEFFYAKDIYPAHYRANTMFKLAYQSFIMLSLVSAYCIVILGLRMKHILVHKMITTKTFGIIVYSIISFILIIHILVYPFFAIQSYYSISLTPTTQCKIHDVICFLNGMYINLQENVKKHQGLDGQKFLLQQYKDDYDSILWMNKNIYGQAVIVEAQGDSYTDYERISSHTGLPTILGWTVHEWLWRGSYDIPAPRIEEIKTLYETTDLLTAEKILKKYKVKYVYIGGLERQKYPNLFEQKFSKLGSIVYKNPSVNIYKVKD